MPALPEPDATKLRALREALPATGAGIYLNTGSAGPLPAPTALAMRELEDLELRLGRADPASWDEFLERMAEARATLAVPLGARPGAVALTHGTTDGLNQAVLAPDWRPGDHIVTTDQEHPGLLGPLLAARQRFGLDLTVVPAAEAEPDALVERVRAAMRPHTRLVALSHVLWTTGALLPIAEIAILAHDAGAWLVVDGAQSVGAIALDVPALGVDFYAFGGQKWLLGPEGTGGLWASERACREARQGAAGSIGYERLGTDLAGARRTDARRFEATTFHRPSITGLARSVGWLAMQVGLPWAIARATSLARETAERLAELPAVALLTPREQMATLVTFRLAGWPADEVAAVLASRLQAVVRTIPEREAVRLSVGFFTAEEELEAVVALLAEMGASTPATLIRRPPLVILRPSSRA
ncbi:MAG: aminotransferase class V-fold PLP-dependent enzyme [Candidatus Limnocylindrales bacterium]